MLQGDPSMVVTCNCLKCQKRTGSVFGAGAYFDNNQVIEKKGESTTFNDVRDAGLAIKREFCPVCGTTVFWEAEFQPGKVGVAVGCFEDPNFPEPIATAWTQTKHSWVEFPSTWLSSQTQEFNKNA